MNRWERENVKLEVLRSNLNKMATTLGTNHIKVLKLSQEVDNLINIIQRECNQGSGLINNRLSRQEEG